uniref:Uncharacterized protein n=1 Tax=viral metagenome TaxID=1070528 RepID=A0A6C0EJZ0_9ZZZZ
MPRSRENCAGLRKSRDRLKRAIANKHAFVNKWGKRLSDSKFREEMRRRGSPVKPAIVHHAQIGRMNSLLSRIEKAIKNDCGAKFGCGCSGGGNANFGMRRKSRSRRRRSRRKSRRRTSRRRRSRRKSRKRSRRRSRRRSR